MSVRKAIRFTLNGEPAPFPRLGTNYIKASARGVAVGKDGKIYCRYSSIFTDAQLAKEQKLILKQKRSNCS